MHDDLDVCDRITAVRCVALDGVNGVTIERMTEDGHRLALNDMTLDVVVVRFVDGEVEGRDGIATVRTHRGIAVNATLGQVLSLEDVVVVLTFADTVADGLEDRLVNNELQSVEHLLAVDDRGIVAVDTRCIELRNLSVPLVNPLIRKIVRTNGDDRIYHRVHDDLDVGDRITAVRCVALDGVNGVTIERMTEDGHRLTLNDMTLDVVVVRFVDREVEDGDRVTTVSCYRGITIYATLGQVLSLEDIEVIVTLADAIVNGNHNRIVDNELQSVEHLLAVDVRGIIAVETGCIELSDLTVPLVDPLIGQIVRTNIYGGIDERVNNHFQNGGTVTTVRRYALLCINGVGSEGMPVSNQRLTLYDMLLTEAVVRFVDGEVECHDGVATVGCGHRVGINTALVEMHALEDIEVVFALTDAVMDLGPFNRQDVDEAHVSAVISVVCLQVLDVLTGLVDRFLEQRAVSVRIHVIPCVRRLAGTDGDGVFEQVGRMNNESYAVDAVASVLRMERVAVAAFCEQRVTCYLVSSLHMDPYVRCIDIGNMNRGVIVMTREHIQAQGDDAVATVLGRQGVIVDTVVVQPARLVIIRQAESYRVALTDGHGDRVVLNRHHLNITHVRTISLVVVCAEVLDILTGVVDIRLGTPGVRSLTRADLNRITIEVCLVDEQVQAVNAVATVLVGVDIRVVTFRIERIACYLNAALLMDPYVRSVRTGHMVRVVVEVTREHIQAQYDDTVTTVDRTNQRILVVTRFGEETRLMGTGQTELNRVAVTQAGIQVGNRLFFVVDQQVVNTIVFNACL